MSSARDTAPHDTAFVYDPRLSNYRLSDNHPFRPIRLELTRTLLAHSGLLTNTHTDIGTDLTPVSDAQLARVHDPHYIELVRAVSRGKRLEEALSYGLGTNDNPIFEGMHEAIALVCAATLRAVELVTSGEATRAVNLAGGLHHALRDKASGFCVYNDLALGILHAVETRGWRVAYLDLDAHHGDGVQWLFYDHPQVMTISLHESGRYLFPGSGHTYEVGQGAGRGTSVNMPLEPFTEDDSYLECFEAVVPAALEVFRPDLIVLQAGADMHRRDPLADLSLSTHGMAASYQRVSELADHFCNGRLVATGGGGYDTYMSVPRAWAHLYAAVSRQRLPDTLPGDWVKGWQRDLEHPLPSTFHDTFNDDDAWEAVPRRKEIADYNRVVVKRLLSSLAPIWQEQQRCREG